MAIRLFKKDPCKDAYPDDGALIHGILKNENRALKCIYEQSFPQIRQFVTQNHGSEQDAEDIFQGAMMAIWQNVKTGKYEKKQNVKLNTYVFQVSKYRWFENLKSARVKYNVQNDTLRYFQGMSEIELANPEGCLQYLTQINVEQSHWGPKAQWYSVLAYLRQNDLEAARQILNEINKNPQHPYFSSSGQILAEMDIK